MNDTEKNLFYDIYKTNTELVLKHTKKLIWLFMLILLSFAFFFAYIAISLVDQLLLKIIFLLLSLLFSMGIILMIASSIFYSFTINQDGISQKNFITSCNIAWKDIADIGICCSKDLITNKYAAKYYPLTTIYFSRYHLSDYEKAHFYEKNIAISKKMIYIQARSCTDMDNICKLVCEYIHKYTDASITRFNSHYLKYGVE